ncbi:MAG TPA: leucyl/phenylalanyl-tRNA--protein transferase [Phycisphaerales bacterium]|nr:leucyl/phenylalanyl-tRNA--protein transferase [Phycisphaerales bacterium]
MSRRVTDQQIVDSLLDAYRLGAFPMGDPRTGRVDFYAPDPRGVLPLTEAEGFHVPRRLARRIGQRPFEIRCDTAFENVIRGCATPRKRYPGHDADDDTWITGTIVHWYTLLHRAGRAHSIEAWARDEATGEEALVGGLYGVALGGAFFGESMFSVPRARRADGSRDPLDGTDSSLICLVTLVEHLHACAFTLFDTQMVTNVVARVGGVEISREEYLARLRPAAERSDCWRPLPGAVRATRD